MGDAPTLGVAVLGGTALTLGTTSHLAGLAHFNRMETWYELPDSEALLAASRPSPGLGAAQEPGLRVLWTDRGLQADLDNRVLTAEGFAEQVGDLETCRRARALKWANTWTGVGLIGSGYAIAMAGMTGLGSERGLAVAGLGALTAGTGVLVLTQGRKGYTDMDIWYTRHEAESWLDGGP